MEVRKGYVEHIVFRNNDNGYTVFQLVSEEEELTCVGLFSVLAEGELVQVSGYMKEHPLYGEQLQVEQYELLAPEDETAMERYLGSGAIKGIGAAMAARIVRRFKGDTFRIIEEEPERLAEVKGISDFVYLQSSDRSGESRFGLAAAHLDAAVDGDRLTSLFRDHERIDVKFVDEGKVGHELGETQERLLNLGDVGGRRAAASA